MKQWAVDVLGMTCGSCARRVKHAIEEAGGRAVSVSFKDGTATFSAEPADGKAFAGAIQAAGYGTGSIREVPTRQTTGHARPTAGEAGGVDAWDMAIIGSGSAAFAAAIRARELGASVVMIERSTIGGTCVNVGCVPSKTLIRAGEIRRLTVHQQFAGLHTSAGPLDLPALVTQKDDLVSTLRAKKYEDLLREYGIDLIRGTATFTGMNTLTVEDRTIAAGKYLVATGAGSMAPPIAGLDEAGYLNSTTALDLKNAPGSLVVIGANAIGLELGQYFNHLGTEVTFFEALDRIAPFEEPEISEALTAVLRDQGSTIHCCARITRVEREGDKKVVVATVEGRAGEVRVVADEILVATGRHPNTADLGMDPAGVALSASGAVEVSDSLRTTNPNIYAAGDVTSAPQFVYVAAYQGALAAENALTVASRSIDLDALPRIIFTTPQVASTGLTEQTVAETGRAVKTSVLPLSAVPRALVNHDTTGVVKIVADANTDRVLGVHILADGAGDVIQAAVYAIKFGLTTSDLADTWAPYLTMAEGLKLAALAFTRDIANLSCCAA